MASPISIEISYMGLNEMISMIYSFVNFCLKLGGPLYLFFFSPENIYSYTMTYNQLIKYTFVNKNETFVFFSLPDLSRIWLLQLALLWT